MYDDLGRLSTVVDSTTGEAAIYQYDAVGNLLGIVRQPASTVSILNFTPKSGPIGTPVSISGTGFSPTASQNTVTFNGTAATVSSATATQLVVTVPSGATTGPIAVTTPTGSATSSTPFTVTTSSTTAPPTITSFTPTIGAPGTSVTITGSNFVTAASENRIVFHTGQATASTATSTSLTTTVPAAATSGPIAVTTPAGTGVSAADFFVPPAPYTAAAVAVTSRLSFGQSQTVTLSTANTIALLLINASAGHRIGVNMTSVTISSSAVSVLDPYGQVVTSATVSTSGAFLDTPTLIVSGTYTIVVDPVGTATGSMTLTVSDIVDLTGPITPGTSVTLNFTTSGQNALLPFQGTAGLRASVLVSSSTVGTCASGRFRFTEPDGTPWITNIVNHNLCANSFFNAETLAQTGTYTFIVDPATTTTGQVTLTLYVFSDLSGSITPGVAKTTTFAIPGQDARFTFANTAGQRVFIAVDNSTLTGSCTASRITLQKPDGSSSNTTACTGSFLETTVISTAGTSTVGIDPSGASTGQVTLTLYEVPDDLTGPITPGASTSVTLATPGQNARLTFAGTEGQRASVRIHSSTITGPGSAVVRLRRPDGTSFAGIATGSSSFLDAVSLSGTGTYTLEVDPYGGNTGQVTLTLYVFSDVTGTLTINGPPVTVTTTLPGQRGLLTFSGTATQQVTVRLTDGTMGIVAIRVRKPDGTVMVTTTSGGTFTVPQQTLPVTGTYTIEVDPSDPLPINTGSITVGVTSP